MTVDVEIFDSYAVLTLNDPDRRNVLSDAMVSAISASMDRLERHGQVCAVVLTGAGTAFCAGAETDALQAAAKGDFAVISKVYEGFLRLRSSPLLTVGAVNGPAVGAGLNLALSCDLLIASTHARFVSRFAQLRLAPGGGHAWMLVRAVGHSRALRAILLDQEWDAVAAHRDGLVVDVVAAEDLLAAAGRLLGPLDGLEPEYVQRVLGTVREADGSLSHARALEHEADQQAWSLTRPAFLEGLRQIQKAIGR